MGEPFRNEKPDFTKFPVPSRKGYDNTAQLPASGHGANCIRHAQWKDLELTGKQMKGELVREMIEFAVIIRIAFLVVGTVFSQLTKPVSKPRDSACLGRLGGEKSRILMG